MLVLNKNLRITVYNILNGGEGRLRHISKVIKDVDPDICGILEAVGWQKRKSYFGNFSRKLGYKFFHIAPANSKYNIAVFSKVPIKVEAIKKGIKHVILKATIQNGPYSNTQVFLVHFSPVSEEERLLEVTELGKHIKKGAKIIVAGDFNSLSFGDPYDKKKLLNTFTKAKVTKYGTTKLQFDVIRKLNSLGLVDVAKHLKYSFTHTTPTLSNKDINHAAKIRIDYIFLSKNIIKDAKWVKVFKSKPADKASDHYPVLLELSR